MPDSEWNGVHRAAEAGGAAEGSALWYSAHAARGGDPSMVVARFERTAFVSSGLAARPDGLGDVYWALWLVQRLRVRVAESRARRGAMPALAACDGFVDGLHAALSAVAHEAMGDEDSAAACLERAAGGPSPVPENREEHSDVGR